MKGRQVDKADRREGGERRADKRRVRDRSTAKTASTSWTLDEAVRLMRRMWPGLQEAGWHIGLTGSVVYRGSSKKDLDLVAYPRDSSPGGSKIHALQCYLRDRGWQRRSGPEATREIWREKGSKDEKHVEVWQTLDGRRVDVMVMR